MLTRFLKTKYPISFTFVYPAHANLFYRSFWFIIALTRLMQKHKQRPLTLIHSHGFTATLLGLTASKLTGVPLITTVHDSSAICQKSASLKSKLYKHLITKVHYAAQISVASCIQKIPNVNQAVTIIPNGVDLHAFDAVKVVKNTTPTLIWVGQDDPHKGIATLREAILKVRKRLPELTTNLITQGSLSQTNLIKAYKQSHVFVLPSFSESQPIALLEAWAAKLPVVVTNTGDNAAMVKDSINGYLVEPGNVQQLATTILKVLRARTKDIEMGQNGYRLVKESYTWDMVAAKTWAIYQQVLK